MSSKTKFIHEPIFVAVFPLQRTIDENRAADQTLRSIRCLREIAASVGLKRKGRGEEIEKL